MVESQKPLKKCNFDMSACFALAFPCEIPPPPPPKTKHQAPKHQKQSRIPTHTPGGLRHVYHYKPHREIVIWISQPALRLLFFVLLAFLPSLQSLPLILQYVALAGIPSLPPPSLLYK